MNTRYNLTQFEPAPEQRPTRPSSNLIWSRCSYLNPNMDPHLISLSLSPACGASPPVAPLQAYAKFCGCYEAMQGGTVTQGLEDLTGGIGYKFDLDKKVSTPYLQPSASLLRA